mmetsp:Transcript_9752/g.20816  ORF Transcript_9752/g.20816 Transcript_9752/m.20816 type:complete len:103 (-) Transcript_9752:117-425(-)
MAHLTGDFSPDTCRSGCAHHVFQTIAVDYSMPTADHWHTSAFETLLINDNKLPYADDREVAQQYQTSSNPLGTFDLNFPSNPRPAPLDANSSPSGSLAAPPP